MLLQAGIERFVQIVHRRRSLCHIIAQFISGLGFRELHELLDPGLWLLLRSIWFHSFVAAAVVVTVYQRRLLSRVIAIR